MKQKVVFALLLSLGTATATEQATANTIVVNSTDDFGSACTLRNAIDNANSNSAIHGGCASGSGADLITFDPNVFSTPQTIVVNSPLPYLTDTAATTIDGGNLVTVSGNDAVSIFVVGSLGSATGSAVFRNIVIAHGNANGSGNNEYYGGGMFMTGTSLELDHVTFDHNSATFGGGGFFTQAGLTTIDGCLFTSNTSPSSAGGGIENSGHDIDIRNSTFTGNSAGSGGAAIFTAYGGTLTVTNSTFNGNSTSYNGSAIRNFSSDPANAVTTVTLDYVTIVGNTSGNGALDAETNASNSVSNSIIAGNSGGDCNGTVNNAGNNFFGNNSCGATGSGDPHLAPLGYSGGPTPTMAPLPGSPVIDGAACDSVDTDQRGVARPQGNGCDIGAVEVEKSLFANGFEFAAG